MTRNEGAHICYSAEELRWIEAHADLPRREAHALFVDRFDRRDISYENIKALCSRKGWKTGRTGRLETGNVPHNKGKPFPAGRSANSAAHHFRKGNRPHTWRGAGHERVDGKDGYVILIVEEKTRGPAPRPDRSSSTAGFGNSRTDPFLRGTFSSAWTTTGSTPTRRIGKRSHARCCPISPAIGDLTTGQPSRTCDPRSLPSRR